MKSILKQHWAAALLSLLLGMGVYATLFVSTIAVPDFNGIYKEVADDQTYYLARARDVIDGHPFVSNPYIAEHKDDPPLQVWLPDYLLATPLHVLSVPVEQGYLFYDFLFVAVLFILVYATAFELTGSILVSILTALFLNCGLFEYDFIRTPSPQFDFVFWMLTALFLLRYQRRRTALNLCLAALSFGLLFNLYPYYWTYWTIAIGIFIVLNFLFAHDKIYKGVFIVLGGGFIIGIPYFISTWQAEHLPFYTETLLRISLVYSHFPSGIAIVLLGCMALGVMCASWWWRLITIDSRALLLISGICAAIIGVNQHVITGENFVFSSHYYIPSIVWFVFTIVFCIATGLRTYPNGRMRRGIIIFLAAIALCTTVINTVHVVKNEYSYTPQDVYEQNYAPILNWLQSNTKTDDVVFADDDLSGLIPVYTGDNVYSDKYGIIFFMSDKEAQTRYVLNHFWDIFTPQYIAANQISIFGGQYSLAYAHNESKNQLRKLFGLPQVTYTEIPQSALEQVENLAHTIQGENFETELKQYRVDYMVWDTNKDPAWHLDQYSFLQKEYESRGLIVYKVL